MQRRDALRKTAVMASGLLALPSLSVFADHAHSAATATSSASAAPWTPQFFSPDQNTLVQTLTELIIPTTDTPGAKGAKVNEWIDMLLANWLDAPDVQQFKDGLAEVEARSQKAHSLPFAQLNVEQQTAILKGMEQEAKSGSTSKGAVFFKQLKSLTIEGYYKSEVGASQELRYDAVHGAWKPDVPVSEVGRAWAS